MLVVIDLENTISNASHRMLLLESKRMCSGDLKERFENQFQEEFVNDSINMNVKLFIDALVKKGYTIVILTAKHEKYRGMVAEWLRRYKVKFDVLVMKQNEETDDFGFKKSYVKLNRKHITFALDDVGAMCEMFGEFNIPCLRIEQK